MLLMEQVFERLVDNGLVETAEDFSQDWCRRSRSWFAVQKNSASDFSTSTAISCLQRVQVKLGLAHLRRKRFGDIVDDELQALQWAKSALERYLEDEFQITGVAQPSAVS